MPQQESEASPVDPSQTNSLLTPQMTSKKKLLRPPTILISPLGGSKVGRAGAFLSDHAVSQAIRPCSVSWERKR